jgi:uncharacterized protein YodC (DUF2158 family)
MAAIKSGDLVVLKSGGPVMTADTVNTDILDDTIVTGVLCAWFFGEKLERARFDPRALEPAPLPEASGGKTEISPEEATGEYKVVLDEMTAAMNIPAEAGKDASRLVVKRPKRAMATTYETHAALPSASGLSS